MRTYIGEKHNRLTVEEIHKGYVMCRCECGTLTKTEVGKMRSGHKKSCGCYKSELRTHGEGNGVNRTVEYRTWSSIKSRCLNPNTNRYHLYGGRGIKICDRWLNSYENFLEDMGRRPDGRYSIDRIDSNGDYCKENCRWVNYNVQNKNRDVPKHECPKCGRVIGWMSNFNKHIKSCNL